jgi:translation initiation factor 2 subunit 1
LRSESESVFAGLTMDEDVQRELQANIARRLTPQPVKIRADVEVTCYNAAGIDAIRAALQAAEDIQTEEIPIKVKLVAPPLYVLITNSTDKVGGIELLEQALVRIDESIKKAGGNLTVKMKVSGAEHLRLLGCSSHAARLSAKGGVRVRGPGAGAAHGTRGEGERAGRGRRVSC